MLCDPIILVNSCVRDRNNGVEHAARECCYYKSAMPYKFFIGDMEPESIDEVGLPYIPDNYWNLAYKTQKSLEWALNKGYTHMFRAFTDTFVDTDRLLAWIHQNWKIDYAGNMMYFAHTDKGFCHGGPGYWLSERAAEKIVALEDVEYSPYKKLEDQWVGHQLFTHGILPVDSKLYSMGQSCGEFEISPLPQNEIITKHLSHQCGKYDPKDMYEAHFWRYREHSPMVDMKGYRL